MVFEVFEPLNPKLYLFTFTINILQIQTTCKIAELIEAGSMETCPLPNTQYFSNDITIYDNYEITIITCTSS